MLLVFEDDVSDHVDHKVTLNVLLAQLLIVEAQHLIDYALDEALDLILHNIHVLSSYSLLFAEIKFSLAFVHFLVRQFVFIVLLLVFSNLIREFLLQFLSVLLVVV